MHSISQRAQVCMGKTSHGETGKGRACSLALIVSGRYRGIRITYHFTYLHCPRDFARQLWQRGGEGGEWKGGVSVCWVGRAVAPRVCWCGCEGSGWKSTEIGDGVRGECVGRAQFASQVPRCKYHRQRSRHPLPQRPSHTGRERRIWVADAHPLVWLLHLLNFLLGIGVRQRGHRATKQRGGADTVVAPKEPTPCITRWAGTLELVVSGWAVGP
jgi:hypothetical protein